MSKNNYTGLDWFRLIAALLVIAIHTSPLGSFSPLGDFVFTRIIARIGVPFFFLVSGFFLLGNPATPTAKLQKFVRNTLLLYGFSILLYLPINLYNGYFEQKQLFIVFLKDLFWNGTLYHLWYLPSSIIGAILTWYLLKHLGYKKTFLIAILLYIIGLFGDSYYGFISQIPFLNDFYNGLFQLFSYTRNGLFFAPLFFILGGWIRNVKKNPTTVVSCIGFCISFLCMLLEGLFLRSQNVQRHDSLYLFLLPTMYFLFCLLLPFRGKKIPWIKPTAMILYIIHPLMIVVVRLLGKVIRLENLFIDHSLIHYVSVVLASVLCACFYYIFTCFWQFKKAQYAFKRSQTQRSWIEVNLQNIVYNANQIASKLPKNCSLMAVLKANAYGHGAIAIAHSLQKAGFNSFAVATLEEGIALRKNHISGSILVLGYTDPSNAALLYRYCLTQTILDPIYATTLNQYGYSIKAHLKLDTGMHRLGLDCNSFAEILTLFSLKNIKICGMFTHFSTSDGKEPSDIAFTQLQIERFYKIAALLKDHGVSDLNLHLQNSSGFFNYPNLESHYVRIGIALYGVQSTDSSSNPFIKTLRPALSLKSKIVLIREMEPFESVGYNRAFISTTKSRIAVLPIGYGDGVPRNLSLGLQEVLVNGQRAPIIGQICMDQLMINITQIQGVHVGTIVTLIGVDGTESISAQEMAENAKSIPNEILCRMGSRLPIIHYSTAKAPV